MLCEFGRTVGPLTPALGRDHYPQQFAFFAGGGVKGGTIIGMWTGLRKADHFMLTRAGLALTQYHPQKSV
jgi:uncharacterized protein (DUF1501 family)